MILEPRIWLDINNLFMMKRDYLHTSNFLANRMFKIICSVSPIIITHSHECKKIPHMTVKKSCSKIIAQKIKVETKSLVESSPILLKVSMP